MKTEAESESASDAASTDEAVSFPRVCTVASQWISDFIFVSVCHMFREGKLEEFNDALTTYNAITRSQTLKGANQNEKTMICAFLSRVKCGKDLGIRFEDDDRVMPLMSAAKMWSSLECSVTAKSLFKEVNILLVVQAVAVCLKKGETSSASCALKWFGRNVELPQNLPERLSTIVADRNTDHQLLRSFSFDRLLETVQTFVDDYLEKNPSDFILKAATKMAQSSENNEDLEDEGTQENTLSETTNSPTRNIRAKRKLMSTKITDVWKPDSNKKLCVSLSRINSNEMDTGA